MIRGWRLWTSRQSLARPWDLQDSKTGRKQGNQGRLPGRRGLRAQEKQSNRRAEGNESTEFQGREGDGGFRGREERLSGRPGPPTAGEEEDGGSLPERGPEHLEKSLSKLMVCNLLMD